jgi:hypothetical protein
MIWRLIDMGYEYECPECGKLHGREYSYGCLPMLMMCDRCSEKEFVFEIRKDERKYVLHRLDLYIKEFARDRDIPHGGWETMIDVDHLEKWFMEPMREEMGIGK